MLGSKWGKTPWRWPTLVAVGLIVAAVIGTPNGSLVAGTRSAAAGTTATAALNAPGALHAARAEGAILLSWKAPAVAGEPRITNAEVSVVSAAGGPAVGVTGATTRLVGSAKTSYTFTGLTNGVAYRFVVREKNSAGLGKPSTSPAIAPAPNARPNILFILTDDQRFDAIPQLPKVNAMAGWLQFTNSYVNEPMCCPSRATIFTGRYSHHTNVQTLLQGKKLDDRRTSATMLHAAGYRTGFLGKYLNGYPFAPGNPVPPGWDDFEAYEGATDYYNYAVNRNGKRVRYGKAPADYSTDVWTGRAANFLRTASPAKPFFLEVAYNAPHTASSGAVIPAPRDIGACATESFPLPASFDLHDQVSEPAWLASQPQWSVAGQIEARQKTCESLRSVDDGVSALINELGSLGRLSNTYVVLMSDNGYEFGEHSLVGKGDLYEESVRVPLIVRGPGVVPGTIDRLTSNVDLVPTFVAWAKTSAPKGFFDGVSWAANARGATAGATNPPDVLLRGCRSSHAVTNPPCGGYLGLPMGMNWGLRTPTYKYIEYPDGYVQLFDLVTDPHELRNLGTDPANAALIAALHAELVARRGF